jgi:hypothetical protein
MSTNLTAIHAYVHTYIHTCIHTYTLHIPWIKNLAKGTIRCGIGHKKHKIYVTSTMHKYYKNFTYRGYFKTYVALAVNNLQIIAVTKVGSGHEISQPSRMNNDYAAGFVFQLFEHLHSYYYNFVIFLHN